MTAEPVITAVIPTYRRPELLARAVESVLAQTYPHLRVLVCDNASGDQTQAVMEAFVRRDPRVVYHRHDSNLGGHANFVFGMNRVQTDYFTVQGDDDFLLPGFYEHAIQALRDQPEAKVFCGQVVLYDQARGTHSLRPTTRWVEGLHPAGSAARLMMEHHFVWTSCLFDTSVLRSMPPFEPASTGDILFMVDAAARFPLVISLLPCAVFAETGENASARMPVHERIDAYERMRVRAHELPNVAQADRQAIADAAERSGVLCINGFFRSSLLAEDWERFDAAVNYLDSKGALGWGKRARVAIARRRRPPAIALRSMLFVLRRLQAYQKMRRSHWQRLSPDELIALYRHFDPAPTR